MTADLGKKLKSLKNRYAFRVSAPSFIYPADYVTNVQRLAACLDEIELLVFESHPQSLPSPQTIAELVRLGNDLEIGYNVHLPLDLKLDAVSAKDSQKAIDLLIRAIERVAPLAASTHTLHLDYREKDHQPDTIASWCAKMTERLEYVIATGIIKSGQISIETLDYPPFYFDGIAAGLGLEVCLDMGHIVRYGHDLNEAIALYGRRTAIIHLHGVADGRDHLSAQMLSPAVQQIVINYLKGFNGTLSLEVFNAERLCDSLTWLEHVFP